MTFLVVLSKNMVFHGISFRKSAVEEINETALADLKCNNYDLRSFKSLKCSLIHSCHPWIAEMTSKLRQYDIPFSNQLK